MIILNKAKRFANQLLSDQCFMLDFIAPIAGKTKLLLGPTTTVTVVFYYMLYQHRFYSRLQLGPQEISPIQEST